MSFKADSVIHKILTYVAKAYSTGTAQTRNEAEIHNLIKLDMSELIGIDKDIIFREFARQIFGLQNPENHFQIILAISVAIQDDGEIQKIYDQFKNRYSVRKTDSPLSSALPEVNASVYSILESLHTRINELERKILK